MIMSLSLLSQKSCFSFVDNINKRYKYVFIHFSFHNFLLFLIISSIYCYFLQFLVIFHLLLLIFVLFLVSSAYFLFFSTISRYFHTNMILSFHDVHVNTRLKKIVESQLVHAFVFHVQ